MYGVSSSYNMSLSTQTKILAQRVNKKKLTWYCEEKLYGKDRGEALSCEQEVCLKTVVQLKFTMANYANIFPPKSYLCTVALCFRHIVE